MKWSNSALALIAALSFSTSIYLAILVVSSDPTSVISISLPGQVGGSFSMKLPPSLTARQSALLSEAYQIAKKDGHSKPEILQGILLQETKAGEMKSYKVAGQEFGLKTNERYYGVCQLKLSAAKDVLSKYSEMWTEFNFQTRTDEEIIAKLIENDTFNMSTCSKYLKVLKAAGFDTIQELSNAFQRGPTGALSQDPSTAQYSLSVMRNIQKLKPKT